MHFTTSVNIKHSEREIGYEDKILMLGSCFSDNISEKLKEAYFQVATNPFGILYNALSIARCIETLTNEDNSQVPIVHHDGLWHSMLHHGDFSCADKKEFEKKIADSVAAGRRAIEEASVITVTFGTAWVYEMNGEVVSNCHKMPSEQFTRRRLSVNEIACCWQKILSLPVMQNKHVIFTVSPIRHLKDGLHENQLSKATLLLACEQLNETRGAVDYFPSYEIMMDELRDYRFYADDMLHPSAVATEYIWQRFADTYFSEFTKSEMKALHQLYTDRQHKPLHEDTTACIEFKEKTEAKADMLRKRYPWIP